MQNITGVDIIFDGDEAGQKAAENIKTMAEAIGLITRNVNLGQNIDPGSLGIQQVKNLRERLYESSIN
jgi:DNA primase